jgi:ABC-type sugar transport system permease subunit
LFARDDLARLDFMTSIRNNAYYVLIVVVLQTVLALGLALWSTTGCCAARASSGPPSTSRR